MKKVFFYFIILIFFILNGCVTIYKPNTVYSPLLKDKGQLNTAASIGVSGSGLFNLQTAYAITDHSGIMLDGMYHNRRRKSADGTIDKLNIFFGEVGYGYFTKIGKQHNGLFQFFTGGGNGSTLDKIYNRDQYQPEISSKYYNIFIQPGLSISDENIEAAFDVRINYVQLYKVNAYEYGKFEWWNTDVNYFYDRTINFVNIEPAVTLKIGDENLKGILQFGLTIPTINPHSYFDANNSSRLILPLIKFSFGVSYNFMLKQSNKNN